MSKINEVQIKNCMYNIKWLRSHHGLSRREMAKILDTGILNIILIEMGKVPDSLSYEVLFKIQDHFGIEPKYMFKEHFE